jgi:hypothetical protein
LFVAQRKTGPEYDTEIHRSALKEGPLHEKEESDRDGKRDCRLSKKGDGSGGNDWASPQQFHRADSADPGGASYQFCTNVSRLSQYPTALNLNTEFLIIPSAIPQLNQASLRISSGELARFAHHSGSVSFTFNHRARNSV